MPSVRKAPGYMQGGAWHKFPLWPKREGEESMLALSVISAVEVFHKMCNTSSRRDCKHPTCLVLPSILRGRQPQEAGGGTTRAQGVSFCWQHQPPILRFSKGLSGQCSLLWAVLTDSGFGINHVFQPAFMETQREVRERLREVCCLKGNAVPPAAPRVEQDLS